VHSSENTVLMVVCMRRRFFEAKHEELDSQLFAQHRELFPAEAYSLDAFLWAVATVRSRVHPPLDGAAVALVPVADLVRHRSLLACADKDLCLAGSMHDARWLLAGAQVRHRRGEGVCVRWAAQSAGPLFAKGQVHRRAPCMHACCSGGGFQSLISDRIQEGTPHVCTLTASYSRCTCLSCGNQSSL
jgi:hypothetical protein